MYFFWYQNNYYYVLYLQIKPVFCNCLGGDRLTLENITLSLQ
ncbi:MAG TPA: hypothetical protein VK203_09625 [Nostocaceae cyanobacterium]|nr:hypothetical protein [Nostocaceae cyanobacterium]